MAAAPKLGKELIRVDDSIVIRVLTPWHRDAVVMTLARAFESEPILSANADVTLAEWLEFVDYWGDHCSQNGLSVVAVDETTHRVAGTLIVRDLAFFADGFLAKYAAAGAAATLAPWMKFLLWLDAEAAKRAPVLASGQPGAGIDLWMLSVHPDYRGRGLANQLVRAAEGTIRDAGFRFATIEATSAFTSAAARLNNFVPLVNKQATDWLLDGKQAFPIAPAKPHGDWTFWLKDVQGGRTEDALVQN